MQIIQEYRIPFYQSIRFCMVLLVLLVAIPYGIIITYSALEQRDARVAEIRNQSKSILLSIASEQQDLISGSEQLLETLSRAQCIREKNVPASSEILMAVLKGNDKYTTILLVDFDGTVIASALPFTPPLSIADREYFQRTILSKKFSIGGYIIGRIAHRPIVSVGYPILGEDGRVTSVLVLGLDLDYMRKIFITYVIPEGANAVILDRSGVALNRILEPEKYVGRQASTETMTRLNEGPDEGSFNSIGIDGIPKEYFYKRMYTKDSAEPYAYVISTVPERLFTEEPRQAMQRYIASFGIILIVVLTATILFAKRKIGDKVKSIVEIIAAFSAGQFEGKATEKVHGGEFGLIAAAFDDMHTTIKRKSEEQSRQEEALRESEHRYRELFEAGSDAILFIESDTGLILEANTRASALFGYSREELLKIRNWELSEEPEETRRTTQEAKTTPGEITRIPLRYLRRKDGTVFPVEITGRSFFWQERPVFIAAFRDITERKQAEDALRKNQLLLNEVGHIAKIGGWEMDLITRRANWTRGTYDIVEIEPGEPIPGPDEHVNYYLPEYRSLVAEAMKALIEESKLLSFEAQLLTAKGNVKWCQAIGQAVREGDQTVKVHGTFQDITERKRAEEALRESEGRLHSLVNALPDLVWLKDLDGVYLACNARFESFFGAKQKDIVGKNDCDFMSKELADFFRSYDKAALEKGGPNINEEEITFAEDGHREILETIKTPMYSNDGRAFGVLGIGRDITERKRAEQELADSELRFRSAVDQAADAFFLMDEHQHFVDVNQEACISLGYTRQELLCMSLHEVDPNTEPDNQSKTIWDKLGSGQKILFQTTHRRKNGSLFPVEVSSSQLELGGQKLIQCFARDISQRIAAEAKLLESSERINALFGATTDSVILIDSDSIILAINETGARRRGRRPQDLIGRSLCETLPGPCAEVRMGKIQEIVHTGQPMVLEEERDGLRYSISMFPVFDKDGEVSQVASFSRDITEFKRVEEERGKLQVQLNQAQKLESVGRLAGGVAHDFNNVLGVILGHAELALDTIDPSHTIRQDLQEIQKAASRSADLTRQLLAFARRQAISPKILDLNETVEGMLKMMRRLIGEDIDLAWLPAKSLWPVRIDPSQIDQILANLCVNARDAISGIGKITIETGACFFDNDYCSMHPGFMPGKFVMLAVSDNGCGMDEETLGKIFEPFYTTKGVGEGTGLGLSTIYGIVKQNNGLINVYSEPGQGTTFKIYLPRVEEQTTEKPPVLVKRDLRGKETVLLVEDEESMLALGKTILQRHGYEVLATKSPNEALGVAQRHPGPIHLLITDVVMPEMNGRDLKNKLAELMPDLKSIFMSGYTANVIAHHGILEEHIHFLQKPFSVETLLEKVREVLDA